MIQRISTCCTLVLLALVTSAQAETFGWRMDGDGRYPGTEPPVSWSTEENVAWKTTLPSWSNASPVLLEDAGLTVVLSEPDEIYGISTNDGSIVWKDSTADLSGGKKAHRANGLATPTPVSDGTHIFAVFGSGVVAAYDLQGKRLWGRVVQPPTHRWGHSASPVLAGGYLIVHFIDLIALDPATGEEKWRADSEVKWGSQVVASVDGTEIVITPSGDVFQAADGKKVASEVGSVEYSTPLIQDGVIYFIEKRATAVRLPESLGAPFETLWTARLQGSRHYASPVIHEGLLYTISREEMFTILDIQTGEILDARQLELDDSGVNGAYPSLSMAGGKIFMSMENGTTVVLEHGKQYQEIARNSIDTFRSSPVFDGERIYVRAGNYLYCFASGKES